MDPDSSGNLFLSLFILLLLIGANAFFAMSEIAVISLNRAKLQKRSEQGDRRAGYLARLTRSSSDFLSTIQVGITLSGFLASAVAAENFAGMLVKAIGDVPIPRSVIEGVSLVVITLILSYFTIIFGELVPKRIAMKNAEGVSLKVATPIWYFSRIAKPFVALLAHSTNGILKLMGLGSEDTEQVSEEDILLLIDEGAGQGVLENSEKDMIENILAAGDRRVEDVMTHRTDMVAVGEDITLPQLLEVIRQEGYSRIPVYGEDVDDILGIVYAKDLLDLVEPDRAAHFSVKDYLRPAVFIPQAKMCGKLLAQMRQDHTHMAVVVDEYGGTAGIATMEDLLESIVGPIEDEYDTQELEFCWQPDGSCIFDGSVTLEEAEKILQTNIPYQGEYDTLAGYVVEVLDRIPSPGEAILLSLGDALQLQVTRIEGQRIAQVRVFPSKKTEQNTENLPGPLEETDG
ncbi:hemolysin family protein [Neobittarella massiliensis]|uniref:hemolysin family protein n=1 Tax=Neobittarella massiliensis (ex Bilen et al. 2018) TaxID=2041842 RepID=UPI000CF649F4|nr:hemolysin family protein [Neobittarella massiliensis]